MNFFRITFLFSLFHVGLFANDYMDSLLSQYQEETKLSKITKRESAGCLELYTRDELEKMQAHNLLDVFKTVPGLILTKDTIAMSTFKNMKMNDIPAASARLYINNHEMTSASFGSAFLIWGDMPIEYVDHIEIYKATSSIEFGNEVASLVIRVYTKQAQREEGGKVRLLASDNGGYDTNLYHAQSLENGFSYFVYANKDNLKRDVYEHTYDTKVYDINDDKESYTLFANLTYDDWLLDLGTYHKTVDTFVGPGTYKTPSGENIESRHSYAHLSKTFKNDIKLQLAYDDMINDGRFIDENGIYISDPDAPTGAWVVNDYKSIFKDKIASVILEKQFKSEKNSLLIGGFYKYKKFEDSAVLQGSLNYEPTDYYNNIEIDNTLHLSSLYFEDNYNYDENLKLILSMKGDFYRYEKSVKSQDKLIARVGVIENIENFQLKAFASYSYIPASFIELYNDNNTPIKANPNLEYPTQIIYNGSIRYKNSGHMFEFIASHIIVDDAIHLDIVEGYTNIDESISSTMLQVKYQYIVDVNNKIYIDYAIGDNSEDVDVSPSYTLGLRLFNRYKKFDFYNELIMKDSYTLYGIYQSFSYDYTAAVKYHLSKDMIIGIRGDNIFDKGYKQVYHNYETALPVTQQRFWLNLEVLF